MWVCACLCVIICACVCACFYVRVRVFTWAGYLTLEGGWTVYVCMRACVLARLHVCASVHVRVFVCSRGRGTFLWRAAGERGEGEVHDVAADDGSL